VERAVGATELVEQFRTEATSAGAVVYEAKDADDANNYVLQLAQEHSVKHVVKSKSVLAEEIGLREHLENSGIEVRETDIEAWIAQLAGEKSAHAVGTTLHKTIEQIAELISKATGEELEPEPQVLLNAARRALRQSYIDADMGISEAGIAIAETGTLVMASNEGNDRLVAILPPVHVSIIGCENLVPTMDDAVVRLKSLGQNTPGRRMSSYVTYITGRNFSGDMGVRTKAQGPEEEHIVLVGKGIT